LGPFGATQAECLMSSSTRAALATGAQPGRSLGSWAKSIKPFH
jgi:hypothetical protein